MKRITIFIAVLLLIPMISLAEDDDLKKLFTKYKSETGFELEVNQPEIDLDFGGDWGFGDFLNDVKNLYILQFDSSRGSQKDLLSFETKLDKLIEKKSFETMIDIDGDGKVQILTRKNSADKTTDYLIITEGDDEAVFIWAAAD